MSGNRRRQARRRDRLTLAQHRGEKFIARGRFPVKPAKAGRNASRSSGQGGRSVGHLRREVRENGFLPLQDFAISFGEGEPAGAIHFGEFLHRAGPRRPLQRKRITCNRRDVDIVVRFDRPSNDDFSAALLVFAKALEATTNPCSSSTSRRAAASSSSPSSTSPFGIDQAPASFFAQNGPPGWTSSTSSRPSFRRKISNPALRFDMSLPQAPLRERAS